MQTFKTMIARRTTTKKTKLKKPSKRKRFEKEKEKRTSDIFESKYWL